ncbi:MAG: CpsB/CapC family capsule biosynthesis tyrosine phosphatase [Spirosomataceae bacterium]
MPFSFLQRKRNSAVGQSRSPSLLVDIHAHILPALDNGPCTLNESIALLQEMAMSGIRKIIATPHIMGDYYQNSTEDILQAQKQLRSELIRRCIPLELEAAAEYYLDVSFFSNLENNNPLLPIDNTYLLLETGIVGMPSFLDEAIEMIQHRNLIPVLAHPERYYYLQQDFEKVRRLHRNGVLFQVNLSSWQSGHQATRTLAERLVNEGLVSFVGSNVHNSRDWGPAREALRSTSFAQSVEKGLLNHHLL